MNLKYFLILTLISSFAFSQVGIGTTTPDNSAILQLESTSQGLLLPRMTTAQRDAISTPANGLFIYNLDSNCFQYFDGTTWSPCIGYATSLTALSCPPAPIVNGYYVAGTPTNVSNTISINLTTTGPDSYSITTNTVNGYHFSGSGVVTTAGTHTIILTSTGTPITSSTDNFTISLAGKPGTCNTTITVSATSPPILKNCQALLTAGYTTTGIYTIDSDGVGGNSPYNCYCDQTINGGGWTLVFNHDVSGGYWTNDTEADNFNIATPGITTNKYSILNKIDELQTTSGTYEFRLYYPDQNITNHWSQTFDPRSGGSPSSPVPGYTGISIGASGSLWGGLENNNNNTYLDGSVSHGNWWYSLGSNNPYGGGGVPGPNDIIAQKVQLYIR